MNGKALTKADIVDYIYEKTERNRAGVKVLVDHLLELMKDSIKRDNSLLVSGFGKFESYDKKARRDAIPRPTPPSCCRRARLWCSACRASSAPS